MAEVIPFHGRGFQEHHAETKYDPINNRYYTKLTVRLQAVEFEGYHKSKAQADAWVRKVLKEVSSEPAATDN